MTAVEAVQTEEQFKVASDYTCAAKKTSLTLQEWWKQSTTNMEQLTWFAHVLIVRLKACFASKCSSMALKRTRMWGCYHRLRTADTFIHDWQRFITQSVGTKAFTAFYQYVTQHIFEKLIKLE